jgi:IPT/TIG domain
MLSGCGHPVFTGSLNEGSGSPQPAAGQPVVSGVSPASVAAGGPGFTVTVTGTNFAPGDTVEFGFSPLTSTYVSPTEMTATVPSQLIDVSNAPTSDTMIVQTPTPNALNFGANISITAAPLPGTAAFTLSTVGVQANDMVWDAASQQIYLSVAGTNLTNPNTITALNPATSQFGTSVSAGPGADHLAISSDDSLLYAGIDKNGTVQRFALPSLASDITIPLGSGPSGPLYYALDLEAAPGSPATIAVSRATSLSQAGSVVIYDGPTARPTTLSTVAGANGYPQPLWSLAWNPSGSDLYGAYNQAYSDPVVVLSVNSSGVQLTESSQPVLMGNIQYSALTGYVYGNQGQIFNPSTNTLGTHLPVNVVEGGVFSGESAPLTVDDTLGMAWVVTAAIDNPNQQMTIEAFDLRTNALLGSIAIPNVTGTPVKLIRWGSNGLAFLTSGAQGPQQGDGVYIISGAFVTTPSLQ